MAHATNPVGPSAVGQGETPVVATASAPYATAGTETGDTTNVVSASYVKGAYNDAIAAVNKVAESVNDVASDVDNLSSDLSNLSSYVNNDIEDEIADKQDVLVSSNNRSIRTEVMSGSFSGLAEILIGDNENEYVVASEDISRILTDGETGEALDDILISAGTTMQLIRDAGTELKSDIGSKRVNAVTTWGSSNTTKLELVNQ